MTSRTFVLASLLIAGFWTGLGSTAGYAVQPAEKQARKNPAQGQGQNTAEPSAKRVGGDYRVAEVKKEGQRSFYIRFESTKATGKFDVLELHSDHVHVAVEEGQTLRLSAEILSAEGETAEVSQVVLFLPSRRGQVPVWLLSSKVPPGGFNASRFLDMHVPLNDYFIL